MAWNGGAWNGVPPVDPNKLHHVFGKQMHNLSGFLQSFNGNIINAYNTVYGAAQAYVTQHNITGIVGASNQITIVVNGFNITFRGSVVDGILRLGTFFIQ